MIKVSGKFGPVPNQDPRPEEYWGVEVRGCIQKFPESITKYMLTTINTR